MLILLTPLHFKHTLLRRHLQMYTYNMIFWIAFFLYVKMKKNCRFSSLILCIICRAWLRAFESVYIIYMSSPFLPLYTRFLRCNQLSVFPLCCCCIPIARYFSILLNLVLASAGAPNILEKTIQSLEIQINKD